MLFRQVTEPEGEARIGKSLTATAQPCNPAKQLFAGQECLPRRRIVCDEGAPFLSGCDKF